MATSKSKSKKASITELLEDLMHLEINTVVKDGMLASPGKKSNYDILRDIFSTYLRAYHNVLTAHDGIKATGETGCLEYRIGENTYEEFKDKKVEKVDWGVSEAPTTFKELHVRLKSLNRLIHVDESLRLPPRHYTILRRVASFCEYLKRLEKEVEFEPAGAKKPKQKKHLYEIDLVAHIFDVELETADEVKIKRMRDLGTETIVMQTRIGLDGDVITRIERDFAENGVDKSLSAEDRDAAKKTVIGLHEKHIDVSLKYWNSLVKMVSDFVSGLIKNKS